MLDVLLDGLYQNGAGRVDHSYISAFATRFFYLFTVLLLMCMHFSGATFLLTDIKYPADSALYTVF